MRTLKDVTSDPDDEVSWIRDLKAELLHDKRSHLREEIDLRDRPQYEYHFFSSFKARNSNLVRVGPTRERLLRRLDAGAELVGVVTRSMAVLGSNNQEFGVD